MMWSVSRLAIAILISPVFIGAGASREPTLRQLIIGYENEGKVDGSVATCTAYVKDEVEWSKADMDRGIRNVCAARNRHIAAYRAVQENYWRFVQALGDDTRLDISAAIANLKVLIKACIDHKFNLTTGGHNIGIDITQNEIAASCLDIGANILRQDIKQLTPR
jgi:hypothetical protein